MCSVSVEKQDEFHDCDVWKIWIEQYFQTLSSQLSPSLIQRIYCNLPQDYRHLERVLHSHCELLKSMPYVVDQKTRDCGFELVLLIKKNSHRLPERRILSNYLKILPSYQERLSFVQSLLERMPE